MAKKVMSLKEKKAKFKEAVWASLNQECKYRIPISELQSIDDDEYAEYVLGYSSSEIDKILQNSIDALPDEYFDLSLNKQMIVMSSIIDNIIICPGDLTKTPTFLDYLDRLLKSLTKAIISVIKEQNQPSLTLVTDVNKLHSSNLEIEYASLKGELFEKNSLQMRQFETKCVNYVNYLTRIGNIDFLVTEKIGSNSLQQVQCLQEINLLNNLIEKGLRFDSEHTNLLAIKARITKLLKGQDLNVFLEKAEASYIEALKGKLGEEKLENGLTKRQDFALRLLTQSIESQRILPEVHKAFLGDFIQRSMGDKKFLHAISKLNLKQNPDISEDTIAILRTFYTRMSKVEQYKIIAHKIENLSQKQGQVVSEQEKITREEIGITLYMEGLLSSLQFIEKAANLDNGVLALIPILRQTKDLTNQMFAKIASETDFRSGDLSLENMSKKRAIKGTTPSLKEKLGDIISSHQHTAKLIKRATVETSPKLFHMTYWGVKEDEILSSEYLLSDFFRFEPSKLLNLNNNMINKLNKKHREGYEKYVDDLYRKIEEELAHDESQGYHTDLVADAINNTMSTLASLIPFFGHSKLFSDDIEKSVHEKITQNQYAHGAKGSKKMMCSEFAARTTAAALIELDKRLKDELGITDPKTHVINMPFDARERFSRIHPDRLIKILQEAKCITQLPRTQTEQHFIRG